MLEAARYEEVLPCSEEFDDWIVCLDDHMAETPDVLGITPLQKRRLTPRSRGKCSTVLATFRERSRQAAD